VARRERLDPHALDRAAQALAQARAAVALTGAGMSVESGIPDFRSPQGLWRTYPPEEYATLSAFRRDPEKVWSMLRGMVDVLSSADPNEGHHALARLQQQGRLRRVITQNIDGLHRRAGNVDPIEVHGSYLGLHCPACRWKDRSAPAPPEGAPRCPRCGGPLKPPVVLFEEGLPQGALGEAMRLAQRCDVMLVVGTSLQVYPVASLPDVAAGAGATLVEINLEPGHLRHHDAIELAGGVATVLPLLAERCGESMG
jgi:NAD-dependent deacetylase